MHYFSIFNMSAEERAVVVVIIPLSRVLFPRCTTELSIDCSAQCTEIYYRIRTFIQLRWSYFVAMYLSIPLIFWEWSVPIKIILAQKLTLLYHTYLLPSELYLTLVIFIQTHIIFQFSLAQIKCFIAHNTASFFLNVNVSEVNFFRNHLMCALLLKFSPV